MTEEIKNKSNKKIVIAAVAIVAALALFFGGIWFFTHQQPNAGAKAIVVTVVDNNGAKTEYKSNTDAEYLKQALDEIDGLKLEGEQSTYGFFISAVNGLTADYDKDKAYWAIYVNGEYGQAGVDTQVVTDGDTYTLKYEVSAA